MSNEMSTKDEELQKIDLIHLLGLFLRRLFRYKWVVLPVVLLCAGGYLLYGRLTYVPRYRTGAVFAIDTSESAIVGSGSSVSTQIRETLPHVLGSDYMNYLIMQELGRDSLPAEITVAGREYANMFSVTVSSEDPQLSYGILQSLLTNFPRVALYTMGQTSLKILDAGELQLQPYNRRGATYYLLRGGAAGAALCCLFIGVSTLFSRTLHDEDELRRSLNLACIATVPRVQFKKRRRRGDLHIHLRNAQTGYGFREAFRTIRVRVERETRRLGAKIIVVTSSISGEGKSTISANLALSLSEKKHRVILLDCDFRNPSVDRVLGLEEIRRRGILEVLSGKLPWQQAICRLPEGGPDIIFGNERKADPGALLSSRALQQLLRVLRREYDYIILDTPPAAMLADASALAAGTDVALYVIKQDYAHMAQIAEGLEALSLSGTKLLGAVFNSSTAEHGGYGAYRYGRYGSYRAYGYGYGSARYGYGGYGGYGNSRGGDGNSRGGDGNLRGEDGNSRGGRQVGTSGSEA